MSTFDAFYYAVTALSYLAVAVHAAREWVWLWLPLAVGGAFVTWSWRADRPRIPAADDNHAGSDRAALIACRCIWARQAADSHATEGDH